MGIAGKVLILSALSVGAFAFLVIFLWLAQQRTRRAANAFQRFADKHPELRVHWKQDGPPPATLRQPVLAGRFSGEAISLQFSGAPNAARGRSGSHCRVAVAIEGVPAELHVRAAAPFEIGERLRTGARDFDAAFVVPGPADSTLAQWLSPTRQRLLLQILGACDSASLDGQEGLVVYFRRLQSDDAQLLTALRQATAWAKELAASD